MAGTNGTGAHQAASKIAVALARRALGLAKSHLRDAIEGLEYAWERNDGPLPHYLHNSLVSALAAEEHQLRIEVILKFLAQHGREPSAGELQILMDDRRESD